MAKARTQAGRSGGGLTDIASLLSLDGVQDNGLVDDRTSRQQGDDEDILNRGGGDDEQAGDELTQEEIEAANQPRQAARQGRQQQQQPPARRQAAKAPVNPLAGILEDEAEATGGDGAVVDEVERKNTDILMGLLKDPYIMEAVKARAANRTFKILDANGEAAGGGGAAAEEAEPDFTTMTQAEIVAYTKKQADKIVSEKLGEFEGRMNQRLGAQENAAAQRKFGEELAQIKEKFPEITEHKDGVTRNLEKYGGAGMTPLEMFALSVGLQTLREKRKGSVERGLQSERPSSTSARPPRDVTRQRQIPANGSQGMKAILDEHLRDFSLSDAVKQVLGD